MFIFFTISTATLTVLGGLGILIIIAIGVLIGGLGSVIAHFMAQYVNIILILEVLFFGFIAYGFGCLFAKGENDSDENFLSGLICTIVVFIQAQIYFFAMYLGIIPEACMLSEFESGVGHILFLLVYVLFTSFILALTFGLLSYAEENFDHDGSFNLVKFGCYLLPLIASLLHCWFWIAIINLSNLISVEEMTAIYPIGKQHILVFIRNFVEKIHGIWW